MKVLIADLIAIALMYQFGAESFAFVLLPIYTHIVGMFGFYAWDIGTSVEYQ